MNDKNYEGLANRLARTGKVVPVATALIFSVFFPGVSAAQSGAVDTVAGPDVVLESVESKAIVLQSHQTGVDVLAPVQQAELMVNSEVETAGSAPTTLALADQAVGIRTKVAGMANESGAVDTVSESVGNESPQKHYALMIALVALISLVPMSRGHQ